MDIILLVIYVALLDFKLPIFMIRLDRVFSSFIGEDMLYNVCLLLIQRLVRWLSEVECVIVCSANVPRALASCRAASAIHAISRTK